MCLEWVEIVYVVLITGLAVYNGTLIWVNRKLTAALEGNERIKREILK